MYVLCCMVVTFPTCQVERSPLKAVAKANTAPHSNKKKSKDKNGLKRKKERALFKNTISAATERRRGKEKQPKKDPILERGEERVYVLRSMVVTCLTCQAEMLALKVGLLKKTHDISVTKDVSQF